MAIIRFRIREINIALIIILIIRKIIAIIRKMI